MISGEQPIPPASTTIGGRVLNRSMSRSELETEEARPYIDEKDTRLRNRISNVEDIQRTFLETGYYEMLGNQEFHDNGESYLIHRRFGDGKYTFGSLFLRKTKHPKPIAAERSVRETEPEIPIEPDPVLEPLPGGLFLSVVICTYNRPRLLREALTSLVEQTLPADRFEVIVVDNNSEDSTKEVARELAATSPNIRSVRETKQGLSHSRNRGCEEARGDYVIYIDDDAKAHARYLATVYRAIQTHKPDILGGPIYPYYTDPRPAWFKDGYETRLNAKETGWSTTCRVSGSNYVIRRDLIKSLGMFDPSLGMVGDKVRLGEERALLNRYRERPVEEQRVYYHLGCVVYHHVPAKKMTLRYYLKRFYVAGRAKARLEGMIRERWGPLTRAKYITQSVWTCVRQSWMTMEKKRQMKQYLLERGGGFMFELGRAMGCLPRFTRRRPGEDEGSSS